MRSLIVGLGEVGSALNELLSCHYEVDVVDKSFQSYSALNDGYDIMHICFPYSDKFIENVKEYQDKYKPKYTVIHSTVPVGTSSAVSSVHSPIRGIHPHLREGIETFVKFLGGPQASEVADYFRRAGMRVCLYNKSETTEALKLFDTEYYRACLEFVQRVKRYCDKHNLSFHEVYTIPNETYNSGYTELGHSEYVRPVLQPIMTEIGGHCVLPNKKLIDG